MNTRAPCKRAQETLFSIGQIRHKSTTRRIPKPKSSEAESSGDVAQRQNHKADKPNYKTYGSKIWVYTHLQRNHMVYSLTKSMRNNFSLRQIPFNGKKTVPPALRKDLWHPFCAITFEPSTKITSPASAIGLSAYQKLREFRRRHELEWDQSEYMDEEGKNFLNKRQVGLRLCDQKANSVADMAYVFSRLAVSDAIPEAARKIQEEAKVSGEGVGNGDSIGLTGDGSGTEVNIEWWDIRDAEFAETWSDNVTHTQMAENLQTNNREARKLWGRGKQRVEERTAREAAAELAQSEISDRETLETRTV